MVRVAQFRRLLSLISVSLPGGSGCARAGLADGASAQVVLVKPLTLRAGQRTWISQSSA